MSAPGLIEQADRYLDRFMPAPGCKLTECTAVKAYIVIALVSIAFSALRSWSNFMGTLIFEAILGLVVVWLCRSCRKRWAWATVIIVSFFPIILGIAFVIGAIMLTLGVKK